MSGVNCTGTETRILDCTFNNNTSSCSRYNDANVICPSKSNFLSVNNYIYYQFIVPFIQTVLMVILG